MEQVFCRQLSLATAGVREPSHFVHLSAALREDSDVWAMFLEQYNGRSLLFFFSQFHFIQVFHNCLAGLGKYSGANSSHYFRIGMATVATDWGLSLERVKRIG